MGYLYAYTKPSYLTHPDNHFRCAIKIGYTSRTPEERIKEQDSTSDAEPLLLQGQWQIPDELGEFDVVTREKLTKRFQEVRQFVLDNAHNLKNPMFDITTK